MAALDASDSDAIPVPIVELPAVAGLAIRRLRAPADYPAMNAVANRCRMADGITFATSDEDFAEFYSHLSNCDPARDLFVVTVDDVVVGYARTAWSQEIAGERALVHDVICFLDPAWTRRGIGQAMLATLEARVREIAEDEPGVPLRYLQTEVGDKAVGQEALLRDAGYEPVRYGFTMLRPNLDDQPDAPLPEGLEIRDVQPEHLRAIWEAEVEALRDHWGATEPTEAGYQQFLDDTSPEEVALWRVAWDGDQVAGQLRSFISETDARTALSYSVPMASMSSRCSNRGSVPQRIPRTAPASASSVRWVATSGWASRSRLHAATAPSARRVSRLSTPAPRSAVPRNTPMFTLCSIGVPAVRGRRRLPARRGGTAAEGSAGRSRLAASQARLEAALTRGQGAPGRAIA